MYEEPGNTVSFVACDALNNTTGNNGIVKERALDSAQEGGGARIGGREGART